MDWLRVICSYEVIQNKSHRRSTPTDISPSSPHTPAENHEPERSCRRTFLIPLLGIHGHKNTEGTLLYLWTLKRTYLMPLYALEHLLLLYEEKPVKWTNHCWAGTSTTTEVEDWKCFMKMLYFEFITYTCKMCWRRRNLPSSGFPAHESICKYLHSFFRLNCLFAYAFLYLDYFKIVLFSWFEDVVFIV